MDVDQAAITACADECVEKDFPCDRDVFDLCCFLMQEQGLKSPLSAEEAVDLYVLLRYTILTNV